MSEWTLDELKDAQARAKRRRAALQADRRAAEREYAARLARLDEEIGEARAEELRLDRERRKLVYGS